MSDTMTDQNAATRTAVQELLRRMGEASPEEFAELFADPFDWQVAGSETVPWLRPRSTRADAADFIRTLREGFVPTARSGSVTRIVVEGADAVVLGYINQTVRASGKKLECPFALHVTVEDGLITRYHVYEDSLLVAELCGSTS